MSRELLGPYEWDHRPSSAIRNIGLAAIAARNGRDAPTTRSAALTDAYRRRESALGRCQVHRFYEERLGLCTKRCGHDGEHRILLLSLADSRAILAGMRRVVEPDPIPEIAPR